MSSLQMLYLESLFGIKIGEFAADVAEFTGHVSLQVIDRVCAERQLAWQNPEAPVIDKAYLILADRDNEVHLAVDFNHNCIYVA